MLSYTLLLLTLSTFLPIGLSRRGSGIHGIHSTGPSTTCSVDDGTSKSVAPFADDSWVSTMTSCLDELNNPSWNGTECVPKDSNGNQLGPTFGFYKVNDSYFKDAVDCWNQCEDCLRREISNKWAVTTHCGCSVDHFGPGIKSHCGMGFDYGT